MLVYFSADKILSKSAYSLKYSLSITIAVLLFELIFAQKGRQTLKLLFKSPSKFKYDLCSMLINLTGVKKALANFFCFGLIAFSQSFMKASGVEPLLNLEALPTFLCFIAALLIYDLSLYFLHRARHFFDPLWVSHSFHHSTVFINPMTLSRQHCLDYLNFYFLLLIPLAFIIPMSLTSLSIWIIVETLSQAIAHSNIGFFNNRLYSAIFVSPAAHHLHHSIEGQEQRRNFGSIFIFWDKIFRTYRAPIKEYVTFGVEGNLGEDKSFIRGYLKIFPMSLTAFLPLRWSEKNGSQSE